MLQELCSHEYHQFADPLISFNDVVTSCYCRNLLPQYKTSLSDFKDAYLKLNISDTAKVHAVFYRIEEFCSLKNMGLAPWSKQATESLHQEFRKCLKIYLVWDIEHPLYTAKGYNKQCRSSTALIFSSFLYDCISSSV